MEQGNPFRRVKSPHSAGDKLGFREVGNLPKATQPQVAELQIHSRVHMSDP